MVRIFARHFFSSRAAVDSFPAIIRNLEHFATRTGWKTEIIASFLPNFPPPAVQTRKVKLTLTVSGENEGAGTKVWEGFFQRNGGITILVDGDMHLLGKEDHEGVLHLIGRMGKEGKACGTAARTIVRLHHNPELDALRIAQEAFYLSFGLPPVPDNPLGLSLARVPQTYRTLGDVFSGCLVLDVDHAAITPFRKEIERMRVQGFFRGFALEYYLGIRLSQLGQVTSTYFPTRPDHAVTDRSPQTVREMIRKDYAELRQSPVGDALARHIAMPAVQRRVAELTSPKAMREGCSLFSIPAKV